MAELKTKPTDESVEAFLDKVDEKRKADCYEILAMMKEVLGEEPKLWGGTIVGFGSYHYKYKTGREGDWYLTGFSPRKQNLTLYIMAGFEQYDQLMAKLGKYKTGKSCLYIKQLADVDKKVLKELIALSAEYVAKTNQ